jgi:predicted transposase YdaD
MPCTHSTPLLDSTRHRQIPLRGVRLYRQDKSGQDKISKGKKEGKNEGKNEGKKEGRMERKKTTKGECVFGVIIS